MKSLKPVYQKQSNLSLLDLLRDPKCNGRKVDRNDGVKHANINNHHPLESNAFTILSKEKDTIRAQSNTTGQELRLIGHLPPTIASQIKKLYLTSNLLSSLKDIEQFTNLEETSIAFNQLRYYEDIVSIKKCLKLKKLDLRGNQITCLPYYLDYLFYLCPTLLTIDGTSMKSKEDHEMRLIQAKLNYSKLSNFLSKGIYHEMRNLFVFHLARKKELHYELLETVYGHFRSQKRSIDHRDHSLSMILRLLRVGGVFDYLISSEERYFSKIVQGELFKIAKATAPPSESRTTGLIEFDTELFQTLFSHQEMFWIKCLEEYNALTHFELDQLEQTTKQTIITEIIEEIEKAFLYTPHLEEKPFTSVGGAHPFHASQRNVTALPGPYRPKLVRFNDENCDHWEEDDQDGVVKESKKRSKVFLPKRTAEQREALSELYTELLRNPKVAARDSTRHTGKKSSDVKKPSITPSRPTKNIGELSSSKATVRLSSETLPSQQMEPDTTDDEAAVQASRVGHSTTIHIFPNQQKAVTNTLSSSLGNEFYHYLALSDEAVQQFLTETEQYSPIIPTIFTNNNYYSEIQQQYQQLYEKYSKHFQQFQSLLNKQQKQEQLIPIEKLERKDYQKVVNVTLDQVRELLDSEAELSSYSEQILQETRNYYDALNELSTRSKEYIEKCLLQYHYQKDSYQAALQWKVQLQAIENVEMERRQRSEGNRKDTEKMRLEYEQFLFERREELKTITQFNTNNINVNEALIAARKELTISTKRTTILAKLQRSSSRRRLHYFLQGWKQYLLQQRRFTQRLDTFQRKRLFHHLHQHWKIWRASLRISRKITHFQRTHSHYNLRKKYYSLWKQSYQKQQVILLRKKNFQKQQLRRYLLKFHQQLIKHSQRRVIDEQHTLYLNLFQLVNTFRAWKQYFFKRFIAFRLYSHRIVMRKIHSHFQVWKIVFHQSSQYSSRKVISFLRDRHEYYYSRLYYYRKWFTFAQQQKRIFTYFTLQRGFKQVCRRITHQRQLRRQFLSDRKNLLIIHFLYYNRWRSYLLRRRQIKLQRYGRFYQQKSSSFSSSSSPYRLERIGKRKNYFDQYHLRKCFQSFLLRIIMKKQRTALLYHRYQAIRRAHDDQILKDLFITWKNQYYFCFLRRLKDQNALLRYFPNEATPAQSFSLPKELNQSIRRSNEDRLLPEVSQSEPTMTNRSEKLRSSTSLPFTFPSIDEQLFRDNRLSSFTANSANTTHPTNSMNASSNTTAAITTFPNNKTPNELLTMRYFYLWYGYYKEMKKLRRIGKLVSRKHRLVIMNKYYSCLYNRMLSTQWKKYQLMIKANQEYHQKIESFSGDAKASQQPIEKLQDLRQVLSNQQYTLETLKVKLATIEDNLQVASLHRADNEQSLVLYQKEKQSLTQQHQSIAQEIGMMKSLFEEQKEEQKKEQFRKKQEVQRLQRKLLSFDSIHRSPSPPALTSFTDLQEYFRQMIEHLNAGSSSSSASSFNPSPSSPASSAMIVKDEDHHHLSLYNEQYLQSLSNQIQSIYQQEIETRQQQQEQQKHKIGQLQQKITDLDSEIQIIQIKLQSQQSQKEQLIASRMHLQQLLLHSQELLKKNAQTLIDDMKRFEEEIEHLQEEKRVLVNQIQLLQEKERQLQDVLQNIKMNKQQEALKNVLFSPLLSKESIEREVDSYVVQNPLREETFLGSKLREYGTIPVTTTITNPTTVITPTYSSAIKSEGGVHDQIKDLIRKYSVNA